MQRVNYHLTNQQINNLKMISKLSGISVAELIRRAIDSLYPTKKNKQERRG
jgi:hypothetical protein